MNYPLVCRTSVKMREIGWSLYCLIAVVLALGLAEEEEPVNYLKSIDQRVNDTEKEEPRSDAAKSTESAEEVAVSDIKTLLNEPSTPGDTNRYILGNLKDGDLYLNSRKHGQGQNNDQKNLSLNENKHESTQNEDLSRSGMPEPHSRLIPYNEQILLHRIPGANHLISCSREGELHNVWSYEHQCLVCACIRDNGLLRSVCASCARCMAPRPDVVTPPAYTTPAWPTIPDEPVTTPAPYEEEVTCKPLPSGVPFENPLHPCQVCVCTESINAYGKPDVNIQCQENPQCVLPTDATPIPYIPDKPVPSPYCDQFPLNVFFPHPSDACQTCLCTEQMSQGQLVKELTCQLNPDCENHTDQPPVPSPYCDQFPLNVFFPHPSDECQTCRCTEQMSQGLLVKVLNCLPIPDCVITELPFYPTEPDIWPTTEIVPTWTPVTQAPTPHGPLPGPSPHDSCQPYIPNQPFQHPWDECQMCVCTEAFARKHVTVEISCFTKKSCCVEPPFDVIPATLPPAHYRPGKLQIQDAICEYRTFGVEFVHPKEPCNVCTCELKGYLITPFCKRSSKPECLLFPTLPVIPEVIIGNSRLPPGSIGSYNTGSSSSASAQSQAMKDAFSSHQNPFGSNGLPLRTTQNSPDQSYKQKYLVPEINLALNAKNMLSPKGLTQLYRPQDNGQGLVYNNQGQGYPGGANGQNYYQQQMNGYSPGYPGMNPGLLRTKEYKSQAQASASAQSNSYGYAPAYPYPGNPGGPLRARGNTVSSAHSSASAQSQAQASAQSSAKFQTRSGNSDDNKSTEKED